MLKSHPSCSDVFLNAMSVLPKFYREKSYDSIRTAIGIWENTCGNIPQIEITNILLSIEEDAFDINTLDSTFINLLQEYSERFQNYTGRPKIYSVEENRFFMFASAWSKLLLENKKPDPDEQFICKVFSGEVQYPVSEIKRNSSVYPELADFVQQNDMAQRRSPRVNLTFISGVWIPTGNLSLLGVKPSVGMQLGARNQRHQIDFTFQFRFLKSVNSYTVKRDGEEITLNNYFGGYIGLDYNYYFISTQKTDFGIVAGMGYDGFDISGSDYYNDYYYNDYLRPLTIGSFNANGGLRFNYYLSPDFYIGLQGRYNWINYANPGGTNLNGDAFSIDLIIGINYKGDH